MRVGRRMAMTLGVSVLMMGPLVAAGSAQEKAATEQEQQVSGAMTGGQAYGQAMSLNQMMERMHALMGTMSGMMGSGEGMGMGGGMMSGQGSMMGPGMMGMTQSMNGLGESMNQMLEQMQEVMGNRELMAQPRVAQRMQHMQSEMGTMLNSYQGMVQNLQELRGQGAERPSR